MTLLAVYMYVGLFRQTHKKRHANKYPNTFHGNTLNYIYIYILYKVMKHEWYWCIMDLF